MRKMGSKVWRALATRERVPAGRGAAGEAEVWITETLPRTTRAVGAWIEQECASSIRAGPA